MIEDLSVLYSIVADIWMIIPDSVRNISLSVFGAAVVFRLIFILVNM